MYLKNKTVLSGTKKTSITIGKCYQDIIKHEISTGKYNSASEVVRAGLLLLENNNKSNKKTT